MVDLHNAIGFSESDLKANQQGILSETQRETLSNRQRRSLRLLSGVAGIVTPMSVGAVLLGNLGIIVLGAMALIIAVLGLVEYLIGYQTYNRDLASNHVETIQGIVSYVWRGESAMGIATTPSGIRMGDVQFLLLEDQARSFIEGEIYTLYYAPATHTLLSAEQVYLQNSFQASDAEIAYWDTSLDKQQSQSS